MRKTTLFVIALLIVFIISLTVLDLKQSADGTQVDDAEINTEIDRLEEKDETKEDEVSNKDIMTQLHEGYEERGEECKVIEDYIHRGNCFAMVNAQYLNWFLSEMKVHFYFPYQREQDHWEEVVFYTVDDSDELGEIQKTDYYGEYLESHSIEEQQFYGDDALQEIWYVFSNTIPKEYRESLTQVHYLDTGEDPVFAVGRDETNPVDTILIASHHIDSYHPSFKSTLIHEFGHVLTLSEDQVSVDEEVFLSDDKELLEAEAEQCPTYYFWGCLNEDSYLYHYYAQFWEDIMDEYSQINWDTEDDYKTFFFEHEERFFNSYQGTSPVEDIAEAFMFFVMMSSEELEEKTEMKYDKVEFFYQFDELVELRTMILENYYDLSVKDKEFY